uniref:Cysteine-rich motor neuron 1 protein n=1 Tax=Parastrongyloides trichosuri TaxID=131310 RepID=A0A0N4ZMA5_PARTI
MNVQFILLIIFISRHIYGNNNNVSNRTYRQTSYCPCPYEEVPSCTCTPNTKVILPSTEMTCACLTQMLCNCLDRIQKLGEKEDTTSLPFFYQPLSTTTNAYSTTIIPSYYYPTTQTYEVCSINCNKICTETCKVTPINNQDMCNNICKTTCETSCQQPNTQIYSTTFSPYSTSSSTTSNNNFINYFTTPYPEIYTTTINYSPPYLSTTSLPPTLMNQDEIQYDCSRECGTRCGGNFPECVDACQRICECESACKYRCIETSSPLYSCMPPCQNICSNDKNIIINLKKFFSSRKGTLSKYNTLINKNGDIKNTKATPSSCLIPCYQNCQTNNSLDSCSKYCPELCNCKDTCIEYCTNKNIPNDQCTSACTSTCKNNNKFKKEIKLLNGTDNESCDALCYESCTLYSKCDELKNYEGIGNCKNQCKNACNIECSSQRLTIECAKVGNDDKICACPNGYRSCGNNSHCCLMARQIERFSLNEKLSLNSQNEIFDSKISLGCTSIKNLPIFGRSSSTGRQSLVTLNRQPSIKRSKSVLSQKEVEENSKILKQFIINQTISPVDPSISKKSFNYCTEANFLEYLQIIVWHIDENYTCKKLRDELNLFLQGFGFEPLQETIFRNIGTNSKYIVDSLVKLINVIEYCDDIIQEDENNLSFEELSNKMYINSLCEIIQNMKDYDNCREEHYKESLKEYLDRLSSSFLCDTVSVEELKAKVEYLITKQKEDENMFKEVEIECERISKMEKENQSLLLQLNHIKTKNFDLHEKLNKNMASIENKNIEIEKVNKDWIETKKEKEKNHLSKDERQKMVERTSIISNRIDSIENEMKNLKKIYERKSCEISDLLKKLDSKSSYFIDNLIKLNKNREEFLLINEINFKLLDMSGNLDNVLNYYKNNVDNIMKKIIENVDKLLIIKNDNLTNLKNNLTNGKLISNDLLNFYVENKETFKDNMIKTDLVKIFSLVCEDNDVDILSKIEKLDEKFCIMFEESLSSRGNINYNNYINETEFFLKGIKRMGELREKINQNHKVFIEHINNLRIFCNNNVLPYL